MPCYHPREIWRVTWETALRAEQNKDSTRRVWKLSKNEGKVPNQWIEKNINQPTSRGFGRYECEVEYVPCGECYGCRMKQARDWAIRQSLEASQYENNYFLTLTLDDEHLTWTPDGMPTLEKDRISKFMNSLRKVVERETGEDGIKFFGCGEYGSRNGRPHYHINVMNCDLLGAGFDLDKPQATGSKAITWQSERLEKLWGRGICRVGVVTPQSAGYVSRYVVKKLKKDDASLYDELGIVPEYQVMSRKPGLGRTYYNNNRDQIYSQDRIDLAALGKLTGTQPPEYFDELLRDENPKLYQQIKLQRQKKALEAETVRQQNTTLTKEQELELMERAAIARGKKLVRMLEESKR